MNLNIREKYDFLTLNLITTPLNECQSCWASTNLVYVNNSDPIIFSTLSSETNFNFPTPPFNFISGIYKKKHVTSLTVIRAMQAWRHNLCALRLVRCSTTTSYQYVIGSSGSLEISCACWVLSVLTGSLFAGYFARLYIFKRCLWKNKTMNYLRHFTEHSNFCR